MLITARTCILPLLLALMAQPPAGAQRSAAHFANPLDVKVADPCIIRHDGTYYLYGTAADPQRANEGFPVWTSEDLVNWRGRGWALRRADDMWGQMWFWGPDVLQRDGAFWMFYGAFREIDGERVGRLCLARSESPLGPFRDVKAPLFDWPAANAIDANVHLDDDGTPYLYFSSAKGGHNQIYVARMVPDMLSLAGDPQLILKPDQPWEVQPVNEGAFVTRHGGRYHLLFSANDFRNPAYCVGYAIANAPLGPFTKIGEYPLIARTSHILGPGCAGLIPSADDSELWAYYHVHLGGQGYLRQLAIDRARFDTHADGMSLLRADGPTHLPQPYPSGASHWPVGESDEFDGEALDRGRWLVVDEAPENWELRDGRLLIHTQEGDMWLGRAGYRNLLMQLAPEGDFEVTTRVTFAPEQNYEQAFLIVWQDADNYLRLSTAHVDGPVIYAASEVRRVYRGAQIENAFGKTVHLRVRRRGDRYDFAASDGGGEWRVVGEGCDVGLQDVKIGVGAISPGSGARRTAAFEWVRIRRSDAR